MKLASLLAAVCCAATLTPVARAQSATFNFDSTVINNGDLTGTTPPIGGGVLGNTNSGFVNDTDSTLLKPDIADPSAPSLTLAIRTTNSVDAGFTQNAEFQFQPNNSNFLATNLSGVVLANVGFSNDVLHLHFSQPISKIRLDFAIVPTNGIQGHNTDSSLQLSGLTTASGTYVPASQDFEGSLVGFGNFTDTALSFNLNIGTYYGYAIDNIVVTPAGTSPVVPEPGVVGLALAGLVPAMGLLRRRRAK